METTEKLTTIVQVLDYLTTHDLSQFAQVVGRWVVEFIDSATGVSEGCFQRFIAD